MRKIKYALPLCLALLLAGCRTGAEEELPQQPPPVTEPPVTDPPAPPMVPDRPETPLQGAAIIYDTDFGLDVDDVGALAMLHVLADRGEATILGVVSNVSDPYSPAAIDVINTYYGRPDIPVGLAEGGYYAEAYPYWRDPSPRYIKNLAETFPHDTSADPAEVPTAVAVYREVLAAQPDRSVTVVSVGFMQNMSALLASGPDVFSPLDGPALVRQKVKKLVIMGGAHPGSSKDLYLAGGREMDASFAKDVLETWPTETVFNTGEVCGAVTNGQTLAKTTPEDNPVRASYTMFFGREGRGRTSWDLCSVLVSVRGLSGPEGRYFDTLTDEHLTLSSQGVSRWVAPGNDRHVRLTRTMDRRVLQRLLEDFITAMPVGE